MTQGAITMSQKEVDRLHVIQRTVATRGYQAVAAQRAIEQVRRARILAVVR